MNGTKRCTCSEGRSLGGMGLVWRVLCFVWINKFTSGTLAESVEDDKPNQRSLMRNPGMLIYGGSVRPHQSMSEHIKMSVSCSHAMDSCLGLLSPWWELDCWVLETIFALPPSCLCMRRRSPLLVQLCVAQSSVGMVNVASQSHEDKSTYDNLEGFGVGKNKWWLDVTNWAKHSPKGGGTWPAGRTSHTTVLWKEAMYVFGGFQYTERAPHYGDFNEVFKLDLKELTWSTLNTSGEVPGPRDEHSAVVANSTGAGKMVVFGGRDANNNMANATFVLDLTTLVWSRPPCFGDHAPAVLGHSAVMHGDSMVVMGGTVLAVTPPRVDDDRHSIQSGYVASLDVATWRWEWPMKTQAADGDVKWPMAMTKHSAVMHGEDMVLYGGYAYNETAGDFLVRNTVWRLRLGSQPPKWELVEFEMAEDPPAPWSGRYSHAAAVHGDEMFVSGGRNIIRADQALLCHDLGLYESTPMNPSIYHHDHCVHNDVVALDLKSRQWRVAYAGGVARSSLRAPRYGHTMLPFKVPPPYGWVKPTTVWTGALVCVPITLLCLGIGMVVALRAATRNAEAVADAIKPYQTLADQRESNAFEGAGVPPTAPPSLNPTQGTGLALVAGCLFLLSGTAFLQEWSEDKEDHYPYKVTSLVFVTELCKLLVSFPMLARQVSEAAGPREVQAMLTFHQSEFRWYWAPAALFTVYNILEYTVVLDLGAGVSRVVMQLKVFFTGLLYDAMARRRFGGTRLHALTEAEWVGMSVLFLAVAVVAGEDLTSHSSMKVAGVFAAIGMGMCGSLANLCTEAILKHQTDHSRGSDQSIFVQNTILYTYTSLLCLLAWVLDVSATGDAKSLFHGWNHKTWMLLVFQVGSGQVVTFMFKFLNNIAFVTVNTASVGFTGVLAALFLGDRLGYFFVVACLLVALSAYVMFKRTLDQPEKKGGYHAITESHFEDDGQDENADKLNHQLGSDVGDEELARPLAHRRSGTASASSGSFGSDDDGSPDNNKHFAGYQLKASMRDDYGASHQDNSREQRTWPAESTACPTQHVPVPKLPSPPRHQTLTGGETKNAHHAPVLDKQTDASESEGAAEKKTQAPVSAAPSADVRNPHFQPIGDFQVGDFYDDSDNEDARKNGPEASSTSTDGLSSTHAANEDLDNDHGNHNALEVQGLLPSLDTI